jgi:hypothetical protein
LRFLGASAAVLGAVIFLVTRPPKPSKEEWAVILAADRIAGWSAALSDICPINRRPLIELLHARIVELRLNESEMDQITKEFAAGISDALPVSPAPNPKEACDTLMKAVTKATEAIGRTLSNADLEKVVSRIRT